MEKRKPTFDLRSFQAAFDAPEKLSMTLAARQGSNALGLSPEKIVKIIQGMERRNFYKSMTSYGNHKEWQDVYHVSYGDLTIYLKFTAHAVTEFRILSFKEK